MGLGLRQFFVAGGWSDLRARLISAVVLGLLILGLTIVGGWPFRLLCFATGLVIFNEWARMTGAKRAGPVYTFAQRTLVTALLAFVLKFYLLALAIVVAAAGFIAFVDWRERKAGWVIGGLLYAALAALAPGMLRGDDSAGLAALGFIIAVVWSTDIFAYFTGRLIGGPKLLPMVSPKKTISGALGGLTAGVVFGTLFAVWFGGGAGPFIPILAAVLSALGQAGDLYESWIKRRFGVKDSGRLIPGHGGLMDRIDALIVAMGAAWLVGLLVAGFANPAHGIFSP